MKLTILKLNERFCQQFCHMLRAYICQIGNLMPATCAGRDDLCSSGWIVDLVEQTLGDLDRQIVFFGERAERAGHSAAGGVEPSGLSSRPMFRKCCHERGIQN